MLQIIFEKKLIIFAIIRHVLLIHKLKMAGLLEKLSRSFSKLKEKIYTTISTTLETSKKWVVRTAEQLGITKVGEKIGETISVIKDKVDKQIYGEQIRHGDKLLPLEPVDTETAKAGAKAIKEVFQGATRSEIDEQLFKMSAPQRMSIMEELAKKAVEAMGVKSNVVIELNEQGVKGEYRRDEDTFYINSLYLDNVFRKESTSVIDTIFHELNHARQWAAVKGAYLGYSDERIIEYAVNFRWYFSDGNDRRYWNQPLEVDSNRMAAMIWQEYESESRNS